MIYSDRQDPKFIKFMTCSPAGGVPLGFVVTSSENEKILTEAFHAFKEILPNFAFHRRGKLRGPVIFMTDDADAEINALRKVWPEATLLLCVWHVLSAVWRWLWASKHQIKNDDRPYLLKIFRSLVYAQSSDDYENCKADFLSDNTCNKYPKYIQHIEKAYFGRKEAWAISVRNDLKLPTHSTNTSNFIEISFRLTKDDQFNRTKAYNLPDLLDILLDDSEYYKKRLLDIGNGRFDAIKNSKSRYVGKESSITEDKISDIGESNFIVESESDENTSYYVNMITGYCECKAGKNCGPCKHKKAIAKYKGIAEFSVLPELDAKMRAMYHYIAQSTICKSSWYRDLENPDVIENVAEFVENRIESNELPETYNDTHSCENNENEQYNDTHSCENNENEQSSSSISESDSDTSANLGKFVSAIDAFKNKVKSVYNKDLKKGVKHFTNRLIKLTKGNVNTLKQSLFSIGKEVSNNKSAGRKKKKGKLIPIQVTAKSRRHYKHRGRAVGIVGRRPKDQEKRTQMIVNNEDENVYHTLPRQKKTKNKEIHSLKHSVDKNKPAAKKH